MYTYVHIVHRTSAGVLYIGVCMQHSLDMEEGIALALLAIGIINYRYGIFFLKSTHIKCTYIRNGNSDNCMTCPIPMSHPLIIYIVC